MHFKDLMKDLYYSSDEEKPTRGRPKGKKTPLSKDEQRARNAELEAKRRQREKKGYAALAISLGMDPNSGVTRDEILATALCLIKESQQPVEELKRRNKLLKREVKACKRRLAESISADTAAAGAVEPPKKECKRPHGLTDIECLAKRHKKSKRSSLVPVVEDPVNALFQLPMKGSDAVTSTAPANPTGSMTFTAQTPPSANFDNYYEHRILKTESSPEITSDYALQQSDGANYEVYTTERVPCPSLWAPHIVPLANAYNQGISTLPNQNTMQLKHEPCEAGASSEFFISSEAQANGTAEHNANLNNLIYSSVDHSSDNLMYGSVDHTSANLIYSSEVQNSSGGVYRPDDTDHMIVMSPYDMFTSTAVQNREIDVEEIISEIPASIGDSIMNELFNHSPLTTPTMYQ